MRKALRYFRENQGRMRYGEYRANGWFIGSGVVESGCRTVVGQRFKQPGMFWSLDGANALLPLRALLKSGRFDEYLDYRVRDLPQGVHRMNALHKNLCAPYKNGIMRARPAAKTGLRFP